MTRYVAATLAFLCGGVSAFAQQEKKPAVIARMQELGTVYLTHRPLPNAPRPPAGSEPKKNAIYSVDFRPTAGSDPKKVAAVVKELASLPDLQSVLLLGQDVTDDALANLPANLISVQFFNTKVTDKGVAKLTGQKKLAVFNFTGMGLTDAGMQELAKVKTLQTLTIVDAKVTDAGVLALKALPSLRRLTIENTLATQRAVDRLREALPRLQDGERFLR